MELKESYDYLGYYTIYPKEGKVVTNLTGREIGKGKESIVLEIGKPNRANRKKMKLIYECVYGKLPKGYVVQAIDGDKTNCKIDNIRAVTRVDYYKDYDWRCKVKLDEKAVEEIRDKFFRLHITEKQLAYDYGVGKSTVYKIIKGNYYYDKQKKKEK